MKNFETIESGWMYNAINAIAFYNQQLKGRRAEGIEDDGGLKEFVSRYSKFKNNGEAELYHNKLDQIVCAEWVREHYSNKQTIEKAWEDLNYNVIGHTYCLQPIVRERRTKEDISKQVIQRYLHWKQNPDQYAYELASEAIAKDKIEFKLLFEALEFLGVNEMNRLNYDDNAMRTELIEVSNKNAYAKIVLILSREYKLGSVYTKASMKQRLQELYDIYGVKTPKGTRKLATAPQFNDLGFMLKDDKAYDEQGAKKPGFQIIKLTYTVSKAA